jgi:hypothetical protein
MLDRETSPSPLRVNTRYAHRDFLDSANNRDQCQTLSPTGQAYCDALDSPTSVGTRYSKQLLVTEHGHNQINEDDLPDNNPSIAKHPEKRCIKIATKSLNKEEIRALINASLPTNREPVDENNRPLSDEEVEKLVTTHPGFWIQIWGEGWESVASTPR